MRNYSLLEVDMMREVLQRRVMAEGEMLGSRRDAKVDEMMRHYLWAGIDPAEVIASGPPDHHADYPNSR